jgi:hypothetical protein
MNPLNCGKPRWTLPCAACCCAVQMTCVEADRVFTMLMGDEVDTPSSSKAKRTARRTTRVFTRCACRV